MGDASRWLVTMAALLLGVGLALLTGRVHKQGAVSSETTRESPRRIVCMSPAATEIIFAIGAGGRVVGVSQHTVYPKEALELPRCGGFFNPNIERILSLRPDLIVSQGAAAELSDFSDRNGIALVALSLSDLDSILREAMRLGELLGLQEKASAFCRDMRERLNRISERVAGAEPVRVLLVTGRRPESLAGIYTVGPNTFLHDVVRAAGGRNVFYDLPVDYGVVNKESLLHRAPEVIVELHGEGGDPEALQRKVRALWAAYDTIPAVRKGRIYAIEETYALIPGPRIVALTERLAQIFHPEATDD